MLYRGWSVTYETKGEKPPLICPLCYPTEGSCSDKYPAFAPGGAYIL